MVAAVFGAALALTSLASVLRSLVIPRGRAGPLLRGTDKAVHACFQLVTKHAAGYEQRDRVLAAQAPAFLGAVLGVWLTGFLVGFALLIWPWTRHFLSAFRESGSSLLTLGFATTPRVGPTVIDRRFGNAERHLGRTMPRLGQSHDVQCRKSASLHHLDAHHAFAADRE